LKVRDLMVREIIKMKSDESIEEAIKILHERHVGSVVITDNEGKCIGIFTERDAIRAIATKVPFNKPLQEVMTKNVLTIWEGASFSEAKQLYKTHGIRHIPVVDEQGYLVGLLSVRSILDELIGM
jgi:CBS domain-containing protein